MEPTSMAHSIAPSVSPSTSIEPTDCYDLYGISEEDIINQIGSKEPIPEDAVKIIHGENVNVTIEISQLWSEDVNLTFFIHYHSTTDDSVCETIPDFFYEDTITKELQCYDGWTDVGIFIYFDNDLNLEECDECRPPEIDQEDYVAYYFELPCEPVCETFEPSEAPTTVEPTKKPTSMAPSITPSVIRSRSIEPTDCYDLYGISEEDIINQIGSNETIPEDAVKIIHGENVNVTIEISQLWSEDANLTFFIHYHPTIDDSVCEEIPDFSYEDTVTKELQCYEGWTDVSIFIYFDNELNPEECDECRPSEVDGENYVAYYFELPCESICESFEPSPALP